MPGSSYAGTQATVAAALCASRVAAVFKYKHRKCLFEILKAYSNIVHQTIRHICKTVSFYVVSNKE